VPCDLKVERLNHVMLIAEPGSEAHKVISEMLVSGQRRLTHTSSSDVSGRGHRQSGARSHLSGHQRLSKLCQTFLKVIEPNWTPVLHGITTESPVKASPVASIGRPRARRAGQNARKICLWRAELALTQTRASMQRRHSLNLRFPPEALPPSAARCCLERLSSGIRLAEVSR